MTPGDLAKLFLLQFSCLLVACRAVGWVGARVRQPQVVAEMITGILLGPSLFGLLLPDLQAALFPKASLPVLFVMSQLGLVLYMFLVGTEFETALVSARIRPALSISLAGIIVPFGLGAALSTWLFSAGYFGPGLSPWQCGLYLGAAMSVTAFPVLARILHEHGIAGTPLGALTLAAGASDDVAAWCLLAAVLASLNGEPTIVLRAILGGTAYVVVVLLAVRPLFARLGARLREGEPLEGGMLAVVLLGAAVGGWFTETIGIHSVFGAFVFGVAMPRGWFVRELKRTLKPLTTYIILPLFFAYSGLNTRIGLLTTASAWALTALVVLIASGGKGIACWAAARANGYPQRDALAIGAMMNTRGLMELIVLNIGLERGLISPTLFTIMVIMAIVTTVASGPLFELAYSERLARQPLGTPSAHFRARS
jgi:Kef-type K+ transport system membrane component KefB